MFTYKYMIPPLQESVSSIGGLAGDLFCAVAQQNLQDEIKTHRWKK